jgi:hypothetical protein
MINYNIDFYGGGMSSSGQSSVSTFIVPVQASTQFPVVGGDLVSYVLTTASPNQWQQVAIASEEDLSDITEADRAMLEARTAGTRSWRQVRKQLGR